MQTFIRTVRPLMLSLIGGLISLGLLGSFALPAAAAQEAYVTPDGRDITAVVECLPEELSEGDLQRAIAESGKDYLERVFQLKEDYSEYDIATAEEEFQACLEAEGVTPKAKRQ